jgi:hypothetical protein
VTAITPDAIRRALADAAHTRDYESDELRDAVAQFASDLRGTGFPPERVLVVVKQVVDEYALTGVSGWWRSILTDRFVRWAVEGYYRIDLGGQSSTDRPPA